MRKNLFRRAFESAFAATFALSASQAGAVSLATDGMGQALVYPYYTARAAQGGNAFNTYLSVGNATSDSKAVRVRIREATEGREVLGFNLYLSPNDVWTAAVIPTNAGARLVTTDTSCTDPPFNNGALDFRNDLYSGAQADGASDGLDRTREGYVEMLEMATLTGESRAAVFHTNAGIVPGCATMRATAAPTVAAPAGGLWGTLTLINVNSGQDFTLDATALDDLASRPYFRAANDSYPDFAAAEIDPVSVVITQNQLYRSVWTRPVDAVSAVLMRLDWIGEYILDEATASYTDFVATLPTRQFYVNADGFAPPFTSPAIRSPSSCFPFGEHIGVVQFNREERVSLDAGPGDPDPTFTSRSLCAAAGVATVRNPAVRMPAAGTATSVLGSEVRGLWGGSIGLQAAFENGFVRLQHAATFATRNLIRSLPQSTRIDLATGQVSAGAHEYAGLPVIGFSVRTFSNGTLQCSGAGSCQGNYGGAFPFRYERSITLPQ